MGHLFNFLKILHIQNGDKLLRGYIQEGSA